MCELVSMVLTKNKVYWLTKSNSHEAIIEHYKLHPDGLRGPNILRVEISPAEDDMSIPLELWQFKVDQDTFPPWYDKDKDEARTRHALKDWADHELTGWNVHEAFHPVNPLKLKPKRMSKKQREKLIREWASVRDSVRASVWDSVGDSVGASVRDSVGDSVGDSVRASVRDSVWDSVGYSVWDSVRASVWDSVWDSVWASVWDSVRASVWDSVGASVGAYIGGLFPNIKEWIGAEKLGPDPWRPLLTLWYAGYVPSFDGTTWKLHAGPKGKIVFELTISDDTNAKK